MSLASRSRCYEIPSWAIARCVATPTSTPSGGTMGVILTGLWHAIVVNPLKAVKAMVTGKK